MGQIGISDATGMGGFTQNTTSPQRLCTGSGSSYTPGQSEEAYQVNIRAGVTLGTLEVGIYNVTAGNANAPLVGSFQVTTTATNALNTFAINSPIALTSGQTYAVAFRAVTNTSVIRAAASGFSRNSTLTGTSALAANWTDNGSTDYKHGIWLDTRSTAAVISDPTPSGTLATQGRATLGATSTQSSGNIYGVISSTQGDITGITAAQVYAAQYSGGGAATFSGNAAVSATSPSLLITGLTPNTLYYYALTHRVGSNNSNVVTGSFTTAVATSTATLTLKDENNVALNAQTLNFWTRTTLNGAAVDGSTNGLSVTSNSSGVFSFSGLSVSAGAGFITVRNPNDNTFSANYPVTFVAGE